MEEGEVRATQLPSSRMGLLRSSSVTGQVTTSVSCLVALALLNLEEPPKGS